jgi:hypothetical protein
MSPMRPLPSTCDSIGELLEARALDALEAAEQAQVEAHLATCERCRGVAAGFAVVTSLLPEALHLASGQRPPAAVRARLLHRLHQAGAQDRAGLPADRADGHAADLVGSGGEAAVQRGPTLLAAVPDARPASGPRGSQTPRGRHEGGPSPEGGAGPRPPAPAKAGSRTRSPWWPRERVAKLLAVAALLALVIGGGIQLGTALARERALRLELALELAALAGQQEVVLEVVDARDGTRRLLRPAPGAPPAYARAYGKVFTRPDLPHVVAMVGRMPPPPPGQAYHLWLLLDGQTKLAGQLGVNADGFGQLVLDADRNGPLYEAAWVTLQPAGSIPAGTTILRWDAPASS